MDWNQFAVGGATRPDSFTNMDPRFNNALAVMFAAAPPNIQQALRVGSGFRSRERQEQLFNASDRTGHTVARPGHSQHEFGRAADLKYLAPAARQWVHDNASQFGLAFPMGYEPWHIELAGARGGNMPVTVPGSATAAMTTPGATAGPNNFMGVAPTPVATSSVPGSSTSAIAFDLLRNAQERKRVEAEEERAAQERRAALFTPPTATPAASPMAAPAQPNIWSLYG